MIVLYRDGSPKKRLSSRVKTDEYILSGWQETKWMTRLYPFPRIEDLRFPSDGTVKELQ